MMRRYLVLLAVAVVAALAVSMFASRPTPAPPPEAAKASFDPPIAMRVEVLADSLAATPGAVPVGRRVAIAVINHAGRPLRIRLSGYEDRIDTGSLAPGKTWQTEFLADRPGEQLAWLVDDQPHGRLDVTGSHLVEGHQ